MPNGTYGGVRGEETKVGQKTFVSRLIRFFVFERAGDQSKEAKESSNLYVAIKSNVND